MRLIEEEIGEIDIGRFGKDIQDLEKHTTMQKEWFKCFVNKLKDNGITKEDLILTTRKFTHVDIYKEVETIINEVYAK